MKLLMSVIYIAVLGILAHYVGESLPRCLFFENVFPFKAHKWERNGKFYDALGIRAWKTHVPDMSRIMKDMLPKKVSYDATSDNISRLVKETCVAEFIHKALCVFSIGVYFIWKNNVGVVLTLVSVICNLPFIMIQRYNRPHLVRLRDKIAKREEKLKHALADSVM